jgi:hypothetical protein
MKSMSALVMQSACRAFQNFNRNIFHLAVGSEFRTAHNTIKELQPVIIQTFYPSLL